MNCLHCKGPMRRGFAPFSTDRHGYHIVWNEVPAWVCVQCGEPYFEVREVALIESALQAVDEQTAALTEGAAAG